MTQIVEHRSALPFGPMVEVHVRHDPDAETPVFATVRVSAFGARPDPEAFPQPLPAAEAFLQALAYGERVGIAACGSTILAGTSPGEASRARRECSLIGSSKGDRPHGPRSATSRTATDEVVHRRPAKAPLIASALDRARSPECVQGGSVDRLMNDQST